MACKRIMAAALCVISLSSAEPPPPSYLPPYELTAPSSPFSNYAAPKPEYGAPSPKPSYNPPQPSYKPPSSSYGAPAPSYHSPRPTYSAPKSSYAPKPARFSPPPAPVYSAPSAPSSSYYSQGHEEYSEPANYQYQYTVQDPHYGTDFGHKESREGDVAHGQYMVLLPDGRRQIVDYVADQHGYRPTIRYEGEANRQSGPY